MPLKLRAALSDAGISHRTFAKEVCTQDGKPMSDSGVSLLLGRDIWPVKTPRSWIEQRARQLLRENRSPRADDIDLFQVDEESVAEVAPKGHRNFAYLDRKPNAKPRPEIEPLEIAMLSSAAKKHFKIARDPFHEEISGPEDVFMSDEYRYIREAMFTTAKHGGLLAVAGESGSGKSTLRRDMLARIQREGHSIRAIFPRSLDKKRMGTGHIAEAIIKDLLPSATVKSSLEAKARQIEQILTSSSRAGNSHVLIIEEAHDLSITTLKYLKRFWEIEDGFKRLLSIVIIGQPELLELLDESKNWEAREVIRRFEIAVLEPLHKCLPEYVKHKFTRVGVDATKAIDDDVYDAIMKRLTRVNPGTREVATQVYPLVVNNLITLALNRAATLGMPMVDGDLIKEL